MRNDTGLLLVVLLLLLLSVMWFPAAILVARVRLLRGQNAQKSKEEMLAALAASGLTASDTPTLADILAAGTAPLKAANPASVEMVDTLPVQASTIEGNAQPSEADGTPHDPVSDR